MAQFSGGRSIIAPNSNLFSDFFTPEINGVLVDAESNKPLPNVDVVVGWVSVSYIFPGSSALSSLKSMHIKTDSDGKFYAPRRYKSLALNLPFYDRENSKSHITIFSLDYSQTKSILNNKTRIVYLQKISNHEMLKDNYNRLESLKGFGNKQEKALATFYLDKFRQHKTEYIRKFNIPTDSQYWLGQM